MRCICDVLFVSKHPHHRQLTKQNVCSTVPLGSIPELPAESCKEIKVSEGPLTVSGMYWFDSIMPGKTVLAHCNMETEGKKH